MSLYPMYARPRSVEEAVGLLAGLSSGAVVVAGGQELMPAVNSGTLMPEVFIDVAGIEALRGIDFNEGVLSIGALTVHRELQGNALVGEHLPLLANSASQVGGGWQVHNRGTIGGNIVAMHPLYDIAPSLLALEVELEIADESGVRTTAFADVLTDTRHGLGSDSLLVRVLARPQPSGSCWGYQKFKSTGGAYGSANAAAIVQLDGQSLSAVRLVVGAAAEKLEVIDLSHIVGKPWSEDVGRTIEAACREAISQPLSDQQGDAEWRRAMAGVVARRAVQQAINSQREEGAA
ncbi:hypothetical protein FV139_00175 [Parahaliea maris]|uniref:FAD-binding PCMH-type domain-containing protein n=1 Tax=Parahaliea maris TaxID=2716870 RepID=A0A5C9A510_9GAMM|nr:FAD binding domain-containing protein [Parahaliea maris]TXS95965.1 hypothetical protein FV139_00175 [Parahaliea maris]